MYGERDDDGDGLLAIVIVLILIVIVGVGLLFDRHNDRFNERITECIAAGRQVIDTNCVDSGVSYSRTSR